MSLSFLYYLVSLCTTAKLVALLLVILTIVLIALLIANELMEDGNPEKLPDFLQTRLKKVVKILLVMIVICVFIPSKEDAKIILGLHVFNKQIESTISTLDKSLPKLDQILQKKLDSLNKIAK